MSFKTKPLNDDLIGLKNTSAIARSLKNIVFTQPGEKFFNQDFGSRITESLFANVDDVSALAIEDEIRSAIINFEPRVNLLNVSVNPNIDDNEMLRTFNCGVGFCLIISPKNLSKINRYFSKNYKPYIIGKISKHQNKVKLNGSINWTT